MQLSFSTMAIRSARLTTLLLRDLLGNEVATTTRRLYWKHQQIVTFSSLSCDHQLCSSTNWNNLRNRCHSTPCLQYLHTSLSSFSSDKPPVNSRTEGGTSTSDKDSNKVDTTQDTTQYKVPTGDGNTASDGSSTGSEENLSVFQRFKKTYKEHGKVLIGVHLVTSAVWFGSFFYAAKIGVDIIPVMEWLGLSEKIINPFRNSSLGDIALAYLMYKLATPARYTVTLTGTNIAIRYLRKTGRMQPKSDSTSLRTLAKDSRTELTRKRSEMMNITKSAVVRRTNRFENRIKERQRKVKDSMKARLSQFQAKWNMPRRGQKKTGSKK